MPRDGNQNAGLVQGCAPVVAPDAFCSWVTRKSYSLYVNHNCTLDTMDFTSSKQLASLQCFLDTFLRSSFHQWMKATNEF